MGDFLTKVLPSQGVYCVAVQKPQGLRQIFADSIEQAVNLIHTWDSYGFTVYFATASFKDNSSRKAENVAYLRALRLDVDCGEGKGYLTKRDAIIATMHFCEELGLPTPVIVDSGGGVHVYWPLTADTTIENWLTPATRLKQACQLYGLNADHAITADAARILRPVGTHNRKYEDRTVTLLGDADAHALAELDHILAKAIEACGEQPLRGFVEDKNLNSDLMGGMEYPESYGERIAERCKQVGLMRDTGGDVGYEHWRGVIGVLKHCVDGEALAHAWSARREETHHSQLDVQQKWDTWSAGPTTCDFFRKQNPSGCEGCPHIKATSPIVLGRPDPEPTAQLEIPEAPPVPSKEVEVPPDYLPKGYRRATDGKLYVKTDDGWREFSKYDVLPVCMERDDIGDIVIKLHVMFPIEGRRELELPLVKLAEPKELKKQLYSKGVCLRSDEDVKTMSGYLIKYIDELQNAAAPIQLYQQMGWTDNNHFVWGDKLLTPTGEAKVSLSSSVPESIKAGFTTSGTLEGWQAAVEPYSRPGMEGYAFGFLSAAGSVLLPMTLYRGVVLSLVSPAPGEGKSTVQKAINSFFGDPALTALQAKDTVLAQYNRLSIYQNIAATVDEVTVMQPDQLSEFVYQIPQGRQRLRLTRDANERANALEWATIVVTSSNQSLVSKLATLKHSAEAESVRIFEYYIRHPRTLKKYEADQLFGKFDTNFGHAGPRFAQHVAQNWVEVNALVSQLQEKIDREADIQSKERFWSALMAVNIAGGIICNQLGLTNFDMKAIYRWAMEQLALMRGVTESTESDAKALLGQYLNEVQNSMLVIDKAPDARRGTIASIRVSPHNALHCRVEQETGKAWINREHIRKWLIGRMADYNEVVRMLSSEKVIVHTSVRKSLGAGTYFTTTPVACWEIDLNSTPIHLVINNDAEAPSVSQQGQSNV